ncbi:uncharacterized protein LOC134230857, partial [Saccostrea cucullata]|uniref:uncharacterized protein LOC134230857 n=1 Tax=Saccostrea cuccullata TaxID=36930 RepID=UPI002ED37D58
MARLTEIRKNNEQRLRDNLEERNRKLNSVKSKLDKKKKEMEEMVKFMEDNKSIMSEYGFIDNHRELSKILSVLDFYVDMKSCELSMRYSKREIRDEVLENMIGKNLNLDNISLTETDSFKYGDDLIVVLGALCEDQCYIREFQSDYIEQSVDGGLLVTLRDKESDPYKFESHSRRLVRHITVTGDVIHEYEYQEDGQTRLFTWPLSVTQNSDICVVNCTSRATGELMIMSPSGHIKYVYCGQNLAVRQSDVVCDSLCNILVTDLVNKQSHLLNPDGEFLKFLLTENEVNLP